MKKGRKLDLIIIFKIPVDGLTRKQAEEQINDLMERNKECGKEFNNFNVIQYWLPVNNENIDIQVINPSLSNFDMISQLKKLIEIVNTPEYIELLNKLDLYKGIKMRADLMDLIHLKNKLERVKEVTE